MEQDVTTAPRTQYHHGDLRAHLVETVRILVEEKGADGFSISEAARRAGVSSAAPYKHFADRGEIVRAVALGGIDRMRAQMEAAAEGAKGDPLAPIMAIGLSYARFARTEPGVFRLMFGLTKDHDEDPELQSRGEACFEVVKREVRAFLGDGPPDAEVLRRSYMLHMFVHGHAFLEIDGKRHLELDSSQEAMVMADIARRIMVD